MAIISTAFVGWVIYRVLRRRFAEGQAVSVERRFEKTLNRFHVEVDRFKLARQGAVKVLLNHDHAIWTHVEQLAREGKVSAARLRINVHRYVEEIVPFFKPLSYYAVGGRVARWLVNTLYRVDYLKSDVERIKQSTQGRPTSVIYVMNHRSNADYVLAAHVLEDRIALSFAVGEWARVWPLEYLFKSFGSYFLRRGFRDPLYHTVLRRYVQLVTKNAVTQALFPEGGLSRDGKFRAPKIGLLDNIISSKMDRTFERELVFVPVALNYDRVLEDRALVAELGKDETQHDKPRRRKRDMARSAASILFGNVRKLTRGEIKRHGVAAVRFGQPVSFDVWHKKLGVDIFNLDKVTRRGHIADFCNLLMDQIAALMPVTPLCIVARALLDQPDTTRPALEVAVKRINALLLIARAHIVGADRGVAWMVDGALERFALRHIVKIDGDKVSVVESELPILRYYANSMDHFESGIVPHVESPPELGAPPPPPGR